MLVWLAPVALLAGRLLWQRKPNSGTCALFWGIAAVAFVLAWSSAFSHAAFGLGMLFNASVTLANGGFMPVAAHRRLRKPARSLWVQRQSGHRLVFLGDNFGNRFIRFSVGDVLLVMGLALAFLGR